MRELSLFSGAGGGLLATKWLLGWECVGYVEIDEYCQAVLAQRIEDGYLDPAPIFGDIGRFIQEGYAEAYQGMVDVITAGFPCQPYSTAGQRKGEIDKRNMWPDLANSIRIVGPRYLLLENVPNLLTYEYFGQILGELAEIGYDCRWDCISASAIGANHQRDRLWIVGHANHKDESIMSKHEQMAGMPKDVSDAKSKQMGIPGQSRIYKGLATDSNRQDKSKFQRGCSASRTSRRQIFVPNDWWKAEPGIPRVDDGLAFRVVQRNKAIGNGQVPLVAATAWRILSKKRP